MKSISDWQKDVHELAREKGWYDGDGALLRRPLEAHMLIACEVAEASEEARKGTPPCYMNLKDGTKPEGELVELADAVIRILDYVQSRGWNLEEAMTLKYEFNKTRPYRHGGKRY